MVEVTSISVVEAPAEIPDGWEEDATGATRVDEPETMNVEVPVITVDTALVNTLV
jgi:hypothetical protein